MSDPNITKLALANALKELMEEKPFEKVTINDIVKRCNLNRQTFYYHFKDKCDLMNWIYYTETAQIMMEKNTIEDWTASLCALCYYMQQNKGFYLKALNTRGQNSFPEYLLQYIRDISRSFVTEKRKNSYSKKKLTFFIEFCSQALIGLIVQWAHNGMQEDPKDYLDMVKAIIDGSMMHEFLDE